MGALCYHAYGSCALVFLASRSYSYSYDASARRRTAKQPELLQQAERERRCPSDSSTAVVVPWNTLLMLGRGLRRDFRCPTSRSCGLCVSREAALQGKR